MFAVLLSTIALLCPSEPPLVVHGFTNYEAQLTSREMVGCTARYVLKSDYPGFFLKYEVHGFLRDVRFGERGRRSVVRLLDARRRLVWATGYNGAKRWTHVYRRVSVVTPKGNPPKILR